MAIKYIDKILPDQPKEDEYGNREYKRLLNFEENNNDSSLNKRATQMKFRLLEGNGKSLYIIGVEDNGKAKGIEKDNLLESICIIQKSSQLIEARVVAIRIYKSKNDKYIGTLRIIQHKDTNKPLDF